MGCPKPFRGDATPTRLLSQQIERDMAQDGKILGSIAGANTTGILVERHIQDPVHLISIPQ